MTALEVLDLSDNEIQVRSLYLLPSFVIHTSAFSCLLHSYFKILSHLDIYMYCIQGSIPAEIGLLSNLRFLRLSYNLFTGAVSENLTALKKLELLQLQSNFITRIPEVDVDESVFRVFAFIADCAFHSECESCTMCCEYSYNFIDQTHSQYLKSI